MDRMQIARELSSISDALGHVSEAVLAGHVYAPRRRRISAGSLLEQQITRLRRIGRALVREEREADEANRPEQRECSACGRQSEMRVVVGATHLCLSCALAQLERVVQP